MIHYRAARIAGAVAAVLLAAGLVAGCDASRTEIGLGSPNFAAQIVLQPALDRPAKADTDAAVGILTARLDSLGVDQYKVTAAEVITVEVGPGVEILAIQRAVQSPGVIEFSTQPGDEAVPEPGALVAGQESLFTSEDVESATLGTDQNGQPNVSIKLNGNAATALANWSATHVGDYLMVVLDGRVVVAPTILGPIPGGELELTIIDDVPGLPLEAFVAILDSGPLPEAWRRN